MSALFAPGLSFARSSRFSALSCSSFWSSWSNLPSTIADRRLPWARLGIGVIGQLYRIVPGRGQCPGGPARGNRSHGLAGAGGARITTFISRVAPQWRPAVRVPRCPLRIPPTAPFPPFSPRRPCRSRRPNCTAICWVGSAPAPASTRPPGNTLPPNCSAARRAATQGRVVRPARHGPAGLFRRRGRRRHAPARRRNPARPAHRGARPMVPGFPRRFRPHRPRRQPDRRSRGSAAGHGRHRPGQGQLEDSEDGETDYMEVMEYLRVAPLLLFAECGKPLEPAPKPSLH